MLTAIAEGGQSVVRADFLLEVQSRLRSAMLGPDDIRSIIAFRHITVFSRRS